MRSIQTIAKDVGALFIIDESQVGCGRTGDFFSFEFADLSPDIIVLSDSLSGCGLPLSILLMKEENDLSRPDEYREALCGNDLALVSATAAINLYWRCRAFSQQVHRMSGRMRRRLTAIAAKYGNRCSVRGRGMMFGFDCQNAEIAEIAVRKALQKGLIIERCGSVQQVVKVFPALTIDSETLDQGLSVFEESLVEAMRYT
ncbi:4-aminobutyrate aminotransferase-like enzyme [Bradyrhizobium japonicum]